MIVNKAHIIPIVRQPTALDQETESPLIEHIASFSADQKPHIYSVIHKTHYSYNSPVALSKHLFRLQPLNDINQTVLNYRFTISVEKGVVANFTGAFGNNASFVEIKEPYSDLHIVGESIVCVQDIQQRTDLLHQPRTMPLVWMPWDRIMMQAYLQPPELPESELFELAEYAMGFVEKNKNDVFAVLSDINQTIYKEYTYLSGSTNLGTTSYEVYARKKGVCQDFANLMICLARLLGVPARYRVGYLYTKEDYKNQADATHAWVEIFLPYVGWIGFDPTNGCPAGKSHIKVACGR